METFFILLVIALATWQTVEIIHHSKLFYPWRQAAERLLDHTSTAFFGDLVGCPFCLSAWVGWIYAAWWYPNPLTAFIVGLAAARLANLGNDCAYNICKTPRYEPETHEPDEPTEDPAETSGIAGPGTV